MQWFKHDADAHRDAKLKRVIMKYGMEGYGLYWHCIELIAGNISTNNLTFELEHDAEIIAHDTGIHYELVQEMVTYMVNLGLFENSHGTITCMKLAKRLDQSMTSNTTLRKKINDLRIEGHDGVMIGSSGGHDNVMQEQNRSEQIRTDENRTEASSANEKPDPKNQNEAATDLPASVDPQLWSEYEQMRKEMRKKLTPTARRNAIKKLADMDDPNSAIRQSLENGWQGIFPPRQGKVQGNDLTAKNRETLSNWTPPQ